MIVSHPAVSVVTIADASSKVEMKMKNRIAEIIINELKLKDVTPETFDPNLDLIEDLGIDSMELTTIVVVLQDEYAIRIDEDDFGQLTTLAKITEYIEQKKG